MSRAGSNRSSTTDERFGCVHCATGVVALAAGEHPVLPKWITHGVAAESAAVARMSTRMNL